MIDESQKTVTINIRDPGHRRRFLRYLRKTLLSEIEQAIDRHSQKLGVKVKCVRIKKLRRRWGSCSENGNINFNLWLVCLPRELIHYVALHEVAHLKEMNHGRGFRRIIKGEMENHKDLEKRLRRIRVSPPVSLMSG